MLYIMLRQLVHKVGRGVRETGQALERMGARAQDNWIFQEKLCRHRALMNLFDQKPQLSAGVFVAPNASVIGSVELKDMASVWCAPRPRARKAAAAAACPPPTRLVLSPTAAVRGGQSVGGGSPLLHLARCLFSHWRRP